MIAPSVGVLILSLFPWPAVFLALALFAAILLLALSRLPESAPTPAIEALTVSTVLKSFSLMLSTRAFLGYQLAGSFSFAALFCYLSTVAYFLPDVFNIPTELFGYAFAATVLGFMTGSLINARVVMHWGMDKTLRTGLVISFLAALSIAGLAPFASHFPITLASLSSIFFLGVGLTAANASMGAISLFRQQAGAASAVYGFTHALLAAAVGAGAGWIYRGQLLEPAMVMLVCSGCALMGLSLIQKRDAATDTMSAD
jgi:DHA1 family bicyclomycin/chloramphenicol resistance-like MFS transporter